MAANGVTNPGGAGDGVYAVAFTGDLAKCALSATITGATPGEITTTPAAVADGATVVTVRTFSLAGATADRPFHLSVNC